MASSFCFCFFSSSGVGSRGATKAIRSPVGDQANPFTPVFESVSRSASPPLGEIRYTCGLPSRADTKPIHFPSGDHTAPPSLFGLLVSRIGAPPSVEASQRSALALLSSRSGTVTV